MAHDVFISCTAADKPVGDAICATLEANAIRCWIAPRDIMPGADWGASIIEAIQKARLMVLVFSAKANASEHIKREVERAVNAGMPIIPVRIEDVMPQGALEYFLSTPHWLDAFTGELAEHLAKLVQVARLLLGQDPGAKPIIVPGQPIPEPSKPAVEHPNMTGSIGNQRLTPTDEGSNEYSAVLKYGLMGLMLLVLLIIAAVLLNGSLLAPQIANTTPAASLDTQGNNADQAQGAANTELAMWNSIAASGDPEQIKAYLQKYPNGTFADVARAKIAAFSASNIRRTGTVTTSLPNEVQSHSLTTTQQTAKTPSLPPLRESDFDQISGISRRTTLDEARQIFGDDFEIVHQRAISIRLPAYDSYVWKSRGVEFVPFNHVCFTCSQYPTDGSAIARLCMTPASQRATLLTGFHHMSALDGFDSWSGEKLSISWDAKSVDVWWL